MRRLILALVIGSALLVPVAYSHPVAPRGGPPPWAMTYDSASRIGTLSTSSDRFPPKGAIIRLFEQLDENFRKVIVTNGSGESREIRFGERDFWPEY